MKIILLGPPGAGKGTQALYLARYYSIPLIVTGNILRAAIQDGTPLGQKVKTIMASGALVPDDIVIDLVKNRIKDPDCASGYLLDGFPRTIAQAEALTKAGVAIDVVIELCVADQEIISRLGGRRIHAASGRTYHIAHQPPKIPERDDLTGEPLIQREDDKEHVVKKRLEVYHAQTKPLINYYKNLITPTKLRYLSIDGVGKLEEVQARIIKAMADS